MSYPEHNKLESGAKPEHRTSNIEPDIVESSQTVIDPVSNDEINLLDLILVLAKHWKMIIGVPFVVAVITAGITLLMPNIYTAKTTIIPSDDSSGGMSALMAQLGGLAGMAGGLGGKTTADLYVTMLKSVTLKDPIIDRFKLMEKYEAELHSSVYQALDGATAISLGKKDGVITIAFSDKDPRFAAEMANAYVDELGRLAAGLTMSGAAQNRLFYEKQIAKTRLDLNRAEEAIKAFQAKNKTISVTDQAKASIEGVAQLRAQLAVKEVELGTLQRQFTDNSQEVKSAKTAVAQLRGQIASLEGKAGFSSSSIPNLGAVPQLGQDYLRLMRDFKIQEAVLETLIKQYEMAKFSESKDTSPFQLLEKAKTPERKSKPRRSQIVIMAVFTSGFLMVLIAFLLEFCAKMSPRDRQRWEQIHGFLPPLPGPAIRVWKRFNS